MTEQRPLAIRFDDETIRRLDALAATMSKRAGGVRISRGAAVRAAVERGLHAMEEEFGIPKGRTKKPPRR